MKKFSIFIILSLLFLLPQASWGIGGISGIGAPLPPNRVGGDNYIRHIGDRLVLLFHEGAGTTVRDLSGNGNSGTFGSGAAAPTWERGRVNFDGTDDYIRLAANFFSKVDFTNGGTFSVYFKAPTRAGYAISIEGAWFIRLLATGEISFNLDGSSFAPSSETTGTPCNDEWRHFGGTWDAETSANVIIRIDAAQDGMSTQDLYDIDSLNRFSAIGSSHNSASGFTDITISFIRINATAFSAPQVLAEYSWNKWRN